MGQELTTAPVFTLAPASFEEALKVAAVLAKSELVPKSYKNKPDDILVAMAWGGEIGLKPLQAVQNIAVINGRGSIWGDAALAVCMARPDFDDIEEVIEGEGDKMTAVCTIKRKGRSPVVRHFSVADAKKAGLWDERPKVTRWKDGQQVEAWNDSPWYKYPKRMLQMRARGFAMRDAFPDAMRGFMLAEEAQDIEPEKDVTPGRPDIVMPQAASAAAAAPAADTAKVVDAVIVETSNSEEAGNVEHQGNQQGTGQQAAEGVVTLSASQIKLVRAKCKAAGIEETALAGGFNVDKIEAIPASQVNAALDKIKSFSGGGAQ